jgi:hypothetical protein
VICAIGSTTASRDQRASRTAFDRCPLWTTSGCLGSRAIGAASPTKAGVDRRTPDTLGARPERARVAVARTRWHSGGDASRVRFDGARHTRGRVSRPGGRIAGRAVDGVSGALARAGRRARSAPARRRSSACGCGGSLCSRSPLANVSRGRTPDASLGRATSAASDQLAQRRDSAAWIRASLGGTYRASTGYPRRIALSGGAAGRGLARLLRPNVLPEVVRLGRRERERAGHERAPRLTLDLGAHGSTARSGRVERPVRG